jgi:hypothetical protein
MYSTAEASGIAVMEFPLPQNRSLSVSMGDRESIGMDSSAPMLLSERHARLGHELGHCLYGGFYTRATPFDLVERHERRADKWYILHAIPRETLFAQLRAGYDVWEIADALNTTEDYVRMAYYYYRENFKEDCVV